MCKIQEAIEIYMGKNNNCDTVQRFYELKAQITEDEYQAYMQAHNYDIDNMRKRNIEYLKPNEEAFLRLYTWGMA